MKLQSLLRKMNKDAFVVICENIETDTFPYVKYRYPKTGRDQILPGRIRDEFEEIDDFFLQDEMYKYKDYNVRYVRLVQDYPSHDVRWIEIHIEKPKKKEGAA